MPIFGIYEKALKPGSFYQMFSDAKKAGYESFELSIDATDERLKRLSWGRVEIERIQRDASDTGISILTMCLSAHKRFPLGSSEPKVVERGVEIMRKAITLAEKVGVRVIQISGFDVYDQEPRTLETQKRYVDNLYNATRMAERYCVTLAIEPVEGNLLAIKDTMKVVNLIDSPFLQIYPDVANINSLGIDPVTELPYGKGHITAIHMRDSLPKIYDATIHFGTGYLDFDGVFRKLKELKFSGPMIVEMWNTKRPDYMEYIIQAREYMEEHIRKEWV